MVCKLGRIPLPEQTHHRDQGSSQPVANGHGIKMIPSLDTVHLRVTENIQTIFLQHDSFSHHICVQEYGESTSSAIPYELADGRKKVLCTVDFGTCSSTN